MLSNEKIFYVYALLDPRKPGPFKYGKWTFSYEPFYIGKGHSNRAKQHLNPCSYRNNKGNTHKKNKIKKIVAEGMSPLVRIGKEGLTEYKALCLEAEIIAAVGRVDMNTGPLTNWSSGGEGGPAFLRGPTVRKKISKAQRARFRRPEEREAMSKASRDWLAANPDKAQAARKKRTEAMRTQECRSKIALGVIEWAEANPNRVQDIRDKRMQSKASWSEKISRKAGGAAIEAYKDNRKVGIYLTQNQAAEALGVWSAAISEFFRGKRPNVNGYTFRKVT